VKSIGHGKVAIVIDIKKDTRLLNTENGEQQFLKEITILASADSRVVKVT